jgi:N-acetylmuramic acid 6-phosphate etherase
MEFIRITEQESNYRHLEQMAVEELLENINKEDATVPAAVQKEIFAIKNLVDAVFNKMISGGRLFYIGAGTSGRLGILDASECPSTYGVPPDLVIGVIAGGNKAVTEAVEHAEDDTEQGWKDLQNYNISKNDIVIGITASGTTPYVIGALKKCKEAGVGTGSISCNKNAPVSVVVNNAVEVVVGPEFVTGSTRMKSGTAQKLVLNMISTAVMIKLDRVQDNKMVNMQLSNEKLIDRGVKMIMEKLGLSDYKKAKALLLKEGNVKKVLPKGGKGN